MALLVALGIIVGKLGYACAVWLSLALAVGYWTWVNIKMWLYGFNIIQIIPCPVSVLVELNVNTKVGGVYRFYTLYMTLK